MELRRPRLEDKETILDMIAEFEGAGSAHDGGFWNGKQFDYEDWLQGIQEAEMGLNLADGFVPSIQLVSFDQTGRAIGFLNLRLMLNETLLNQGGHIGYSIRPSARGKGYAKEQLMLGLQEARKKNIKGALLICQTDNPASRAVILANGGVLEDVRDGLERYWIDLSTKNGPSLFEHDGK